MNKRLFVGVLGNQKSGKSKTWSTLFGRSVKTGIKPRPLTLYDEECVDVFLISGSPEERQLDVSDILDDQNCRIILCSIQYIEEVRKTLDYVIEKNFDIFIQWLNPGHDDKGENFDRLGLIPWLLEKEATVSMRNGKTAPNSRAEEIRQFVYGWVKGN